MFLQMFLQNYLQKIYLAIIILRNTQVNLYLSYIFDILVLPFFEEFTEKVRT